jgi:hypothetical protein
MTISGVKLTLDLAAKRERALAVVETLERRVQLALLALDAAEAEDDRGAKDRLIRDAIQQLRPMVAGSHPL